MPLTHDELCQIACRFLQNNGFKVAFHDRFRAWTNTGEQADAIGFRNGASCLIEAKCSRADLLADRKKPFRVNPERGMGDWRFFISEPGIVGVDDLPPGWGLLHVVKGRVKKIYGWPEKARLVVQDSSGYVNFFINQQPVYFDNHWVGGDWIVSTNFYADAGVANDHATAIITREQYEAALQHPVWDGEGLPPVGCECEFFDCEKWFKVTMMYGGSQLVVLYDHDNQIERSFSTSRIDGKFRPICSEADKKRDEVGLAIYHAINWNSEGELVSPKRMEDYKKAYDAIAAGNIPHIRIE